MKTRQSPRARRSSEAVPAASSPAVPAATAEPAEAGLEPASRLRRARLLGHRVTPAMLRAAGRPAAATDLSPRPATAQRIQRLKAKIGVVGGKVISALMSGHRPPGNLYSGTGDHTTPYVTFEHMAQNNVLDQTLDDAVYNLVLILKRTQDLPGYADAGAQTKKYLDAYANPLIAFGESLVAPTAKDVEKLMVGVVALRNAVPMSAYKHTKSKGGHGEAATAGGLNWAEFMVRNGTWTTKADFTGNPMQNVWNTFDFLAPTALTARDWARLLRQHILSIRESYPQIFEIEQIYTMQDMEDYLTATVLPAKFGGAFAQEVEDELGNI